MYDYFNVAAGLASIVSLAFALTIHYRHRVAKTREEANIRILGERLHNLDVGLRAAATNLQILIRRADSADAPVKELQNLARSVRTSIYASIIETRGTGGNLKEWRFGQLLKSEDLGDSEGVAQDHAAEAERPQAVAGT